VLLFLGLTAGFLVALRVTRAPARTMRLTLVLLGVALVQGLIGYAQYFSGLPWVLVAIHMLGACLVWASVVFVALSMRARGPVTAPA
jgi:cytochrome c oxidase assembly protein subunit 15